MSGKGATYAVFEGLFFFGFVATSTMRRIPPRPTPAAPPTNVPIETVESSLPLSRVERRLAGQLCLSDPHAASSFLIALCLRPKNTPETMKLAAPRPSTVAPIGTSADGPRFSSGSGELPAPGMGDGAA